MRKLAVLFLLLFSTVSYLFPVNAYDSRAIPPALKENAIAVIRCQEEHFNITSVKSAKGSIKFAITVLDNNADNHSVFYAYYDEFRRISNIRITIYDKYGDIYEKVKSSDIEDYSAVSGYSVFEDNRIRFYRPVVKEYPYTVEYEYDIEYVGLFNYPTWQPVNDYGLSIEESLFTVTVPSGFGFRYRESNLENGGNLQQSGKSNVFSWEINNWLARKEERYSPPLIDITPVVYTAPVEFEIDGYSGRMESWTEFGKWGNKLNEGRDALPGKTLEEIRSLLEGVNDTEEIVRRIYRYVQSTTRYVSIQEGIGGWQPMPAEEVAMLGYGDCKALTNYTMSLLKAAGVNSYYTKVRAGQGARDIMKDFVSNQSNHVFLCVPIENDTVWLECTSQVNPFGYLGSFTDDRYVVVLNENGGNIVRSKAYPREDNTQVRRVFVDFLQDNSCKAYVNTVSSGLQFEEILMAYQQSYEDQEKWLYSANGLSDSNINIFSLSVEMESEAIGSVTQEIIIKGYTTQSGKRMFLMPNMFNQAKSIPPEYEERKNDIVLNYPYVDIDSITYRLPEGYKIEYIPDNNEYVTEFGEFSTKISVTGNELLYIRTRKMNKGTYPSSAYSRFREFFRNIVNADKGKVVLVKV